MAELERIPDNLKLLIPNLVVVDEESLPSSSEPFCECCGGSGWLSQQEENGRGARPIPCDVCKLVLRRRMERQFRSAKIPNRFYDCTFESFPSTPQSAAALAQIHYWFDPDIEDDDESQWGPWVAWRKQGLFIYGPFGTGKSGLAIAGLRLWDDVKLFVKVPMLLDEIRATYGERSEHRESELLDTVNNVPLLVLDDIGAERPTEWVREKLFTIIDHRHDENLDTVFTSNLSIEELAEHIGERTVWRIVEMCAVVKLDGPNLRDKGSVG